MPIFWTKSTTDHPVRHFLKLNINRKIICHFSNISDKSCKTFLCSAARTSKPANSEGWNCFKKSWFNISCCQLITSFAENICFVEVKDAKNLSTLLLFFVNIVQLTHDVSVTCEDASKKEEKNVILKSPHFERISWWTVWPDLVVWDKPGRFQTLPGRQKSSLVGADQEP